MSIKQIDTGLKRYYKHKNVVYEDSDGMGKFELWCEENEYDIEAIVEELKTEPEEIAFIDFDENFPTINTDDKERINEIFKVIHACYKEPAAFFDSPDLPNEYTHDEYTQLERAKQQSLLELDDNNNNNINNNINNNNQYQYQYHDNDDDPHISFVATSKKMNKNNINDDINDIYDVENNNYNYNYNKATDVVYETDLRSSNLSVSLIKDNELKLAYETAIKLLNIGNKSFVNNNYNHALGNYIKIIVYLGINSIRKLEYFYKNNYIDIIYEAIDKLRISAYIGMSYVYKKQNKLNKVIEICSEILEQDDINIFALLERGVAYRKLGKLKKAQTDLEKAKQSKHVYIEIEKELNFLNKNDTINNKNWPQLPIRNIIFEEWLNGNNNNNINIYEILYPIPSKKYEYKLYKNQEMLDCSIIWLDVQVVQKLINLNLFDINKQDEINKQTYINQLSTGNLLSGLNYTANMNKFCAIIQILCNNTNIDLELEDINKYTPLANAIKNMAQMGKDTNKQELTFNYNISFDEWSEVARHSASVIILLKYGANINHESVQVQIKQNKNNIKHIIKQCLDTLRQNTLESIQYVTSMYGIRDNKFVSVILDFILSSWDSNVEDVD